MRWTDAAQLGRHCDVVNAEEAGPWCFSIRGHAPAPAPAPAAAGAGAEQIRGGDTTTVTATYRSHRLSGKALPQLPVRATARPGQPGPGRKIWRRADAEPGFATTRRKAPVAVPLCEEGCPGTSVRSRPSGCRWSSGGRTRWTACRTTLHSSLAQDDGFRRPHRRVLPGTVGAGRGTTGDLPRARRKTGKDAKPTVGDARVRARQPGDRRAPLSRPAAHPSHLFRPLVVTIATAPSTSSSTSPEAATQALFRRARPSRRGRAVTALRRKSITAKVSPSGDATGAPP